MMPVLRGMAEAEIARLRDGTLPWSWWLDHAARHGRFGFTNTLLIAAQWRSATDVRSYDEWRAQGRQVRKGEPGIRIISRGGRARSVFDIAQTNGIPLRTPPALSQTEAHDRLRRAAHDLGLRANGASATTLAHRLGLKLLPEGFEADSVAYLVLCHLGLPTSHLTFPPAPDLDIQQAGDRILDAALQIRDLLTEPPRAELAALQAAAHLFFCARTAESWVPAYLTGRGLTPYIPQVGYAPNTWHALTDHLRGLGHGDNEIIASGLARRGRGGVTYDMFRDRVMLPVRDANGTIAGFIGRHPDGATGPVYLNSPATALFHKGELLFNLAESQPRLASGARPILVEGPFDALAVTLATGDDLAAVAPCGSSFTPAQLRTLGSVADLTTTGVLVALDGDIAGRSATLRAWDVLARTSGPVEAVLLPDGDDPADLLRRHGAAALRETLRATLPLADLVIDTAIERAGAALESPEDRLAAVRAATSLIAHMAPARVPRQVARVADHLDLDHPTVTQALTTAVSPIATQGGR